MKEIKRVPVFLKHSVDAFVLVFNRMDRNHCYGDMY